MNRTNQQAGCRRYEVSNHSTSLPAASANSQPAQLKIAASSRKINQLRNSNSQLFPCLQILGEMMTAKGKAAGRFATLRMTILVRLSLLVRGGVAAGAGFAGALFDG